MKIQYIKGDVLELQAGGIERKLIIHICNNQGCWGGGFTGALSNKWGEPEAYYRRWHYLGIDPLNSKNRFELGSVQIVPFQKYIYVANMIAQNGIISKNNRHPIRYESVEDCLIKVQEFLLAEKTPYFSIHAPKIGSGLGGGDWLEVENIINKVFGHLPNNIYIYELEAKKKKNKNAIY